MWRFPQWLASPQPVSDFGRDSLGSTTPKAAAGPPHGLARAVSTTTVAKLVEPENPIHQLTERLYCFIYEEDAAQWKEAIYLSTLSDQYMLGLKAAAAHIRASHDKPELAMILNLGPAWGKTDAYSLFANNVIEIPFKDWETPAGLGICPLDVIFTACASILSWLNLDDDNIVVLHTRSRSGLGMHFIRFLAACYLVFNMDFGNVTKALESLPPFVLQRPLSGLPDGLQVEAKAGNAGAPKPLARTRGGSWRVGGPHAGPAQQRYSEYFCRVLYSPVLRQPKHLAKLLRQVVFSELGSLDYGALNSGAYSGMMEGLGYEEDVSPFLVVFQHGSQIWGGFPITQEGLVPYNINLPVVGDVAIAVWFGSYNLGQRIHTQPALAYCFHTAFAESGVERVSVQQLNVADGALFPAAAARKFFLDIQLADWDEPMEEQGDPDEVDQPGDVQWMRSKWRDTMSKMYGSDKRPQEGQMDEVLEELKGNRQYQRQVIRAKEDGPSQDELILTPKAASLASPASDRHTSAAEERPVDDPSRRSSPSETPDQADGSPGAAEAPQTASSVPEADREATGNTREAEEEQDGLLDEAIGGQADWATSSFDRTFSSVMKADSARDRTSELDHERDMLPGTESIREGEANGGDQEKATGISKPASKGQPIQRSLESELNEAHFTDESHARAPPAVEGNQKYKPTVSAWEGDATTLSTSERDKDQKVAGVSSSLRQVERRTAQQDGCVVGSDQRSSCTASSVSLEPISSTGRDVVPTSASVQPSDDAGSEHFTCVGPAKGVTGELQQPCTTSQSLKVERNGDSQSSTQQQVRAGLSTEDAAQDEQQRLQQLKEREESHSRASTQQGLSAADQLPTQERGRPVDRQQPAVAAPPLPPSRGQPQSKPPPPPPPPPLPGKPPQSIPLPKTAPENSESSKRGPPVPPPPPKLGKGPSAPPRVPGAPPPAPLLPKATGPQQQPRVKLRSLFWTKVPARGDTIWAKITPPPPVLTEEQLTALEHLFPQSTSTVLSKAKSKPGAKAKESGDVVKVIPLSRANNVSIMLTQFSNFKRGSEGIRRAVFTGKGLGIERLSLLLQIAPKEDEVKALGAYDGPASELSPPEQFLLTMSSVPRLVDKINILILIQQYEAIVQSAEASIRVVEKACNQIRSSSRLRSILRSTLATGNLMNAGSNRGNAQGIKLDTLMKLADVKVTKEPKKKGADGDKQVESPKEPTDGRSDAHSEGIPELSTLLEFIAWMALQSLREEIKFAKSGIRSSISSHWLKGRGGYLLDQLDAVREASIRLQGELTETVKALDAGVEAAESELEQAEAAAQQLVQVKLVARPEEKTEAPKKAVGSLKNSALMQKLQNQLGGPAPSVSPIALPMPKAPPKSSTNAPPAPQPPMGKAPPAPPKAPPPPPKAPPPKAPPPPPKAPPPKAPPPPPKPAPPKAPPPPPKAPPPPPPPPPTRYGGAVPPAPPPPPGAPPPPPPPPKKLAGAPTAPPPPALPKKEGSHSKPIMNGNATAGASAPVEDGLLTVDGLTFRKYQLVRMTLSSSEVAADESAFAQLLSGFLKKALSERTAINGKAEATQASLSELAVFLGEKADSEPSSIFALLHNFTKSFDSTLVQVAKRHNQLTDEDEAEEFGKG